MSMLSRVADRVYWTARYLERAEDTARLIVAYHHLIMDIPKGSQLEWDILFRILDAEPIFFDRFRVANEQNVMRLLVADHEAYCSIPHAIRSARENVRTTRDVLPDEIWELVNELHLFTRDNAEKSVGRRNRQGFLQEVVDRCQLINGVLRSTLCRDHAYRFSKIGQLLERADMTTRVIDVGAGDILRRENAQEALEHLLWGTLLKSLNALGAYRRVVGPVIAKDATVDFVFTEATFPRSVRFCLDGIREELAGLKNRDDTLKLVDRARRRIRRFSSDKFDGEGLHNYIDDFQLLINSIHGSIDRTWFQTGPK
jgi:uncharacterized alpha-E superfamily protein